MVQHPSVLRIQGTFELDAEWWTGDPLNGGAFIGDASSTFINYSATVTSAVTSSLPEPSCLNLIMI